MDLQQIKFFLELSKELHFGNTSEKVFITQSALSRQIKALEEELGVTLFERTKRSVKLTAAGQFLRERWQRLVEDINSIHKQAQQIHEGTYGAISIGYPGSIVYGFLPELLIHIHQNIPHLKVELIEPTDITFEHLLLNYQMDLGFRREPGVNPTLRSTCLYSESFALIVPASHQLNQENFTSLAELKDEKFILSGLHHNTFYVQSLNAIFQEYQFSPNVYIESDFGATILSLVARGLGVSILPGSYAFSAQPGIRFIQLPQKASLYAIWRKDDNNPMLKNVMHLVHLVSEKFKLLEDQVVNNS
ncbi:LysR family transcriptional regulator [Rhodocytophaga rosea]|uniref:LysR family transcriptional regulator n=1 Tax=Rhodocytophaga rosea TaxID=2704465 RepID=A0A6C0GPC1_9BACT|nr:LysR substrate-binding domain-containing protein [Rhodocytophaga rosea]QHT69470.1 LysR family transcriptional regulator [Rhodocytophaga rosea]